MDETIPLLVMAAVAVIAVRWLFAKNEDNNQQPNGDQGGDSRAAEMVTRLSAMFPHIPQDVIHTELRRANYSLQTCIDRLLQLNLTSPVIESTSVLRSEPDALAPAPCQDTDSTTLLDPLKIDKATWEQNATIRQALLRSRKTAMLKEARERMKRFTSDAQSSILDPSSHPTNPKQE